MTGETMYGRILELTEEIEAVIPTDDHARLEELRVRRAEAFAAAEAKGEQASPEAIALIEKIQECEKRCREQALSKLATLKKDMDGLRKGKRLEKAYGRFVGNV
ncbi:MAG: flagellar protein FliT [Desulfobulbia bacterium]